MSKWFVEHRRGEVETQLNKRMEPKINTRKETQTKATQRGVRQTKDVNLSLTLEREDRLSHQDLSLRDHDLGGVDQGTRLRDLEDLHPLEPLSRAGVGRVGRRTAFTVCASVKKVHF